MRRRLLFGGKGWEAPPPPAGKVIFKPNGFIYDVTYTNNGETKTIAVLSTLSKTVTLDSYDNDFVITDIKFRKPANQNVELKFNSLIFTDSNYRPVIVRNLPYHGGVDIYGSGGVVEVEADMVYSFGLISDNPEQVTVSVDAGNGAKNVNLTRNTPVVTTVETTAII